MAAPAAASIRFWLVTFFFASSHFQYVILTTEADRGGILVVRRFQERV